MDKPNYFGILPANVRYDKKLPPMAKILFTELSALTNKHGYCTATNSYFAELYDKSERSVSSWFAALEKAGYISMDFEVNTSGTLRKIFLSGVEKNFKGGRKKLQEGVEKNFYHNNTRDNNTSVYKEQEKNTHQFPDISPAKSYDHNDKRKNKQLPFDLVSAHETMNALYADPKILQKEYTELYGYTPDMEIIKHCKQTFVTTGVASYYQTIRDLDKFRSLLYEWITKEIKYRRNVKNKDKIQPIYSFKNDISNA